MNRRFLWALMGASALALSACGGSSDGGSDDLGASQGETLDQYDDLRDLFDDTQDGTLSTEDTSTRTGQATLTGAVELNDVDDDANLDLVGDLSITADFDADTATGEATGFTVFDVDTGTVDSDVTGSLALSNAAISGTNFGADLGGTLGNLGDEFDVDLELTGEFYDNNGDLVVAGTAEGTISDAGSTPSADDAVSGGFVATE